MTDTGAGSSRNRCDFSSIGMTVRCTRTNLYKLSRENRQFSRNIPFFFYYHRFHSPLLRFSISTSFGCPLIATLSLQNFLIAATALFRVNILQWHFYNAHLLLQFNWSIIQINTQRRLQIRPSFVIRSMGKLLPVYSIRFAYNDPRIAKRCSL